MVACPSCGFPNADGRNICKSCRGDLRAPPPGRSDAPLDDAARATILDAELRRQSGAGWRVTMRSAHSAQLVREVSAVNALVFLLLLCLAVLPGILYAVFAKRTETLFVQVDAYGRVVRSAGP